MRARVWAASAAVVLVACGCGVKQQKAEAEGVATACFDCVKEGDFEGTLDFYSAKFYQATSRKKWLEMRERIREKLGELQEYKLVGWNFRKWVGSGAGTYWQLQYETTYSKHPAQEVIVVFKPLRGGEYKIVSHNINSEGLLLE